VTSARILGRAKAKENGDNRQPSGRLSRLTLTYGVVVGVGVGVVWAWTNCARIGRVSMLGC
jgi:hypothetical protein